MKKRALLRRVFFRPILPAKIPAANGAIRAPSATIDPTQEVSSFVRGRPMGLLSSAVDRNDSSGEGHPRVVPSTTLDRFTVEEHKLDAFSNSQSHCTAFYNSYTNYTMQAR